MKPTTERQTNMAEETDTNPPTNEGGFTATGGSLPKRQAVRFLQATKLMMDALDAAEGMTAHEMLCFQHNTHQFIAQMIIAAGAHETAIKLPMRRHDWGKQETGENDQGSVNLPPMTSQPHTATAAGSLHPLVQPCGCRACLIERDERCFGWPIASTHMIVCETCGNKRCPHAADHRNACTGSNEPNQPGSVFGGLNVRVGQPEGETK